MASLLALCEVIRARRSVLIQERQEHAIRVLLPSALAYTDAKAIDTAYGVAINEIERLYATARGLEDLEAPHDTSSGL